MVIRKSMRTGLSKPLNEKNETRVDTTMNSVATQNFLRDVAVGCCCSALASLSVASWPRSMTSKSSSTRYGLQASLLAAPSMPSALDFFGVDFGDDLNRNQK